MTSRTQKIIEIIALAATPMALALCAAFQTDQSALFTLIISLMGITFFFTSFEASKPSLRHIMPTVVLAALATAGRIMFSPFPSFKPVTAICIVAGATFGRQTGFMVGALAALVSNFFFGQGPWTPWQMYAWGMTGYIAAILTNRDLFKHQAMLYMYGIVASLSFGALLNTWFLVGYVHPITWQSAAITYGASLVFDVTQSLATCAFLLAIYTPWRKKLLRVKEKYR